MGDSTIIIALAKNTLWHHQDGASSTPFPNMTYENHTIKKSADSTLREIVDCIHDKINKSASSSITHVPTTPQPVELSASIGKELQMIDCTFHPPKILPYSSSNNQYSGPNSITLQSLNWFPGGRIVVVRHEDADAGLQAILSNLASVEKHDYVATDGEKKNVSNDSSKGEEKRVVLKSETTNHNNYNNNEKSLPLPSEVFASVKSRFENDESNQPSTSAVTDDMTISTTISTRRRRTEEERCLKLDSTIRNLDAKKKNKSSSDKVSEKVRHMLIKSRSEGNKKLREEDRFYLELVVVIDHPIASPSSSPTSSSSFCFFSNLSTVGRVATSTAAKHCQRASNSDSQMVELLVKTPSPSRSKSIGEDDGGRYWRLPNTMTLHEARTMGYLYLFQRVVVRIFDAIGESGADSMDSASMHTTSILEFHPKQEEDNEKEQQSTIPTNNEPLHSSSLPISKNSISNTTTSQMDVDCATNNTPKWTKLNALLESYDVNGKKLKTSSIKKKKSTATSDKVRKMVIKSRAKGEKAIKEIDRFYLHIIAFHDHHEGGGVAQEESTSHFLFFSKNVDINQIITTVIGNNNRVKEEANGIGYEFCVRQEVKNSGNNDGDETNGKSGLLPYLFKVIPSTMALRQAESIGDISSFDRVVLRKFRN